MAPGCGPPGLRGHLSDALLLLQSSFSFEAGRRCPSGEGSFEFDTKQGNLLFKAVEDAISRQQTLPQRQVSRGNQGGPELQDQNPSLERPPPRPLPRSHIPAAQVQASLPPVLNWSPVIT